MSSTPPTFLLNMGKADATQSVKAVVQYLTQMIPASEIIHQDIQAVCADQTWYKRCNEFSIDICFALIGGLFYVGELSCHEGSETKLNFSVYCRIKMPEHFKFICESNVWYLDWIETPTLRRRLKFQVSCTAAKIVITPNTFASRVLDVDMYLPQYIAACVIKIEWVTIQPSTIPIKIINWSTG